MCVTSVSHAAEMVKKQDIVDYQLHKVKSGETLWFLSGKYGVPIKHIKDFNGLKSTRIKQGQTLKIPYFKTLYLIKINKGDTLWSVSRQFKTTVEEIKQFNSLTVNTIYPGQHLVLIKDKPDNFYPTGELPTWQEVFINWKENYWIIKTIKELTPDEKAKEQLDDRITRKDSLTRAELAVMVEQILDRLEEQEEMDNTLEEKITLDRDNVDQLYSIVQLLHDELVEMGVKVNKVEKNLKTLDTEMGKELTGVKQDVTGLKSDVGLIEKEVEKEREITRNYNQFRISGFTRLDYTKDLINNNLDPAISQTFFFNANTVLSSQKQINFFLEADYILDQGTDIKIGSNGDFTLNKHNKFNFTFAHQQPFNTSTEKQTYVDLNYLLTTKFMDLNVLTAHGNYKTAQASLNSARALFKTPIMEFEADYYNKDYNLNYLIIGRDYLPGERYFRDFILEEIDFMGYKVVSPLVVEDHRVLNLMLPVKDVYRITAGLEEMDGLSGTVIGLRKEGKPWDMRVDYLFWEDKALLDRTLRSEFNFKYALFNFGLDLYYTWADETLMTNRYMTEVGLELTDYLKAELAYTKEKVKSGVALPELEYMGMGLEFRF
ncbi:LysM peptidoglycan-binding domain-containing protein [Halothermothrix orenii]|uniref:LysM peptidoglycan-binding domain-containing protein n=1 Tax=Halothermothrix orenii TaxID=31909 RepID=UPI001438ED71|nr:LysM peptidoglycan-binding domain-containing protein [Halothermothrix orenii]